MNKRKSYSTFADWGTGWADPEIHCQRLGKKKMIKQKASKAKTTTNYETSIFIFKLLFEIMY